MAKLLSLIICLAFILGGCAFAAQAVKINPQLNLSPMDIGKGKTIYLNVVDERPSEGLGNRGGAGFGAMLTVDGDLTALITHSIDQGLTSQGFQVLRKRESTEGELRVEIRALSHEVSRGFWSGSLNTDSAMKGICIHSKVRDYEKLYRSHNKMSIVVVQGKDSNNNLINNSLSKTINEMLSDTELTDCLAGKGSDTAVK